VEEFRLLGPLEVVVDGEPLQLGGPKQRAIVAVLAAQLPAVVSSDTLMEAVWGDDAAERTAQHLQTYVSNLRRTLDPAFGRRVIVTRRPGYVLDADPASVDLNSFRARAAHARELVEQHRDQDAITVFEEAEGFWRGDLLADLQFEPVMALVDRSPLEERLSLIEERVACQLRLGLHAQLIGELEALVGAQPLRERRWSQLMVALYRSGRQAEALNAYGRARELLRDELGLDPSADLQQLERRILDQDPELDLDLGDSGRVAAPVEPPDDGPLEAARPVGAAGQHTPSGSWAALQSGSGLLVVEAAGGTVCVRAVSGTEVRTIHRSRVGGRVEVIVASTDGAVIGASVDGSFATADVGPTGALRWSGRRRPLPPVDHLVAVTPAGEPVTSGRNERTVAFAQRTVSLVDDRLEGCPDQLAALDEPWTGLDAGTSGRGELLVATAGAGPSTLHLLLRTGRRIEHRRVDTGVHLDAVAVARPVDRRGPPSVVCGTAEGAIWWWTWDAAEVAG